MFTVTSNADSGPGTLREALTLAAANGSAVKDFINFNIADLSEAGRTIKILSMLPSVTSNIQIDGATQSGAPFGVSDAKVRLLLSVYESTVLINACLSMENQTDIEIYGLFLDRAPSLFSQYTSARGIDATTVKRLRIGAPGKGCIISNFENDIVVDNEFPNQTDLSEDITIQSNFIGITSDGMSVCELKAAAVELLEVRNVTVGGANPQEGNVMTGNLLISEYYGHFATLGAVLVSNNKFGLNYSGTQELLKRAPVHAGAIAVSGNVLSCEISNNLSLDELTLFPDCFFFVKGNKFGTDITGTKVIPHNGMAIIPSYTTAGGKIGGTTLADQNIFAGSFLDPLSVLDNFGVIFNVESPGIEVVGNIFKCNGGLRPIKLWNADPRAPVISNRSATAIAGTATANSRVDLYYSIECSYCEPQQLFASLTSDANGNWQFSGNILNYAVIASSTINGSTSEFSSLHFTYAPEDVKIQPACNGKDGSIKGLSSNGASTFAWYNEAGIVVATTQELVGAIPGKYYLVITAGDCAATSPIFEIKDTAVEINTSAMQNTPVSCNNGGSITGITAGASLLAEWRDQQQNVRSGTLDLINVEAGSYSLTVFTADKNCSQTIGPFEIKNANVPGLDLSGQGGLSATCNENNGSIRGLKTTNASTYQWTITGTNTVKSTQIDLTNVPAGFYTLTISNATCSKSYDFEVAGFPPTVFSGITYTQTKTCAAFNTGTITLNTDKANEEPTQYLWLDEKGPPVGYTKEVQFLKAGKYTLQLTNKNFCPVTYPEIFVIEAYPEFNVNSFGTVTNTQCGVGIGGVSGITLSGGTGNYTYQWLDADNNDSPMPGKTQAALSNVLKGRYKLRITDGGCNLAELPYTIIDEAVTPPTPSVNNIQVYNTGPAVLKVNSPFPTAIYRIYETATSAQPIKDTIGGNININVAESRSYYVSLTYGYCESARTEVKVFLSALKGNIPNTFTPNGDGINDYWNIPGLDTYPGATVNIYNRYGTTVFQAIGYAKPFDGTSNGKPLPVGVYYYIITLKKGDVLSGNVTIVR
ncbi:gliding motility-associated C-terminal domain-containing protein [Mucilaginibacter psychrotolerans]|uniref:gliding motility-associated C-terminal domain-containing protein n=1 Tax=Mucilaginibacter psychrotolerans TaxID=1524096 RepID=UPI0013050A42|nr:gliding motility-associated C-terminal domain-containing protein [Mucilaginibacter psychrotolerans]